MTLHEGATVAFHDDAFRLSMTLREVDERYPSCRWEVAFQAGEHLGSVGMSMSLWFGEAAWDAFMRDLRSMISPYADNRTTSAAQLSAMGVGWCLHIAREASARPGSDAYRISLSHRCRVAVDDQAVQMDFSALVDIDVVIRIERSFRLE